MTLMEKNRNGREEKVKIAIKLLQKKGLNIVEIPGEYYNYYKIHFIN